MHAEKEDEWRERHAHIPKRAGAGGGPSHCRSLLREPRDLTMVDPLLPQVRVAVEPRDGCRLPPRGAAVAGSREVRYRADQSRHGPHPGQPNGGQVEAVSNLAHPREATLSPDKLLALPQRRVELLDADVRAAVRQPVAKADPELHAEPVRLLGFDPTTDA